MYIDFTYIILVLPAVILSLWASANVKNTYAKYSKVHNSRGLTANQAARRVLDANGLRNVMIMTTPGELTDHFDPSSNVVYLSENVVNSTSTASVGVACHEVGHAIQHAQNYLPVKIRTAIVPVTNFGAKISIPLVLIGLLLASVSKTFITVAYIGVLCFALSAVFQLVTLPTEFDASRRAMSSIEELNLLDSEEQKGARKVLRAAALTYVAALAVTIMQLLRLIVMVSGNGRRRS